MTGMYYYHHQRYNDAGRIFYTTGGFLNSEKMLDKAQTEYLEENICIDGNENLLEDDLYYFSLKLHPNMSEDELQQLFDNSSEERGGWNSKEEILYGLRTETSAAFYPDNGQYVFRITVKNYTISEEMVEFLSEQMTKVYGERIYYNYDGHTTGQKWNNVSFYYYKTSMKQDTFFLRFFEAMVRYPNMGHQGWITEAYDYTAPYFIIRIYVS